jgi:hypothetical protein
LLRINSVPYKFCNYKLWNYKLCYWAYSSLLISFSDVTFPSFSNFFFVHILPFIFKSEPPPPYTTWAAFQRDFVKKIGTSWCKMKHEQFSLLYRSNKTALIEVTIFTNVPCKDDNNSDLLQIYKFTNLCHHTDNVYFNSIFMNICFISVFMSKLYKCVRFRQTCFLSLLKTLQGPPSRSILFYCRGGLLFLILPVII